MAKIIIKSECELYNGMPVTFKAPCACNAVDGLKVQGEDWTAVFTFKDAHGNDLTGIGNLFDKGAIVKAVLDTENGGAFVQNADTNAYIEGRFAEMVQSVNGQRGDVILTAERIGAAVSSVVDVSVLAVKYETRYGSAIAETTLTARLYTSGKLFALEIPEYSAGVWDAQSPKDILYLTNLPEGYRIFEYTAENDGTSFYVEVDKDSKTILIQPNGSSKNGKISLNIYGVVEGEGAGGTGGIEPDWVQAVIDIASGAKETAEEAKAGTEQFAATLDALDTGLRDAKEDITALEQAQLDNADTIHTVADELPLIKDEIARINKELEDSDSVADMSALDATGGVERVDADGKVYIRGKAATSAEFGMVKVTQENGVGIGSDGQLKVRKAEKRTISERKSEYQPIVPSMLEYAVQTVTHQQMGSTYYPDDMGFENGSTLPVSYAAVLNYINHLPALGGVIIGATLEREE